MVCFGHALLSRDTAEAFDGRFANYGVRSYGKPALGYVYTPHTEQMLIDAIAGPDVASWKRCF